MVSISSQDTGVAGSGGGALTLDELGFCVWQVFTVVTAPLLGVDCLEVTVALTIDIQVQLTKLPQGFWDWGGNLLVTLSS